MKPIFIFFSLFLLPCAIFCQSWKLTGNSGTNSSLNFVGTTDERALIFKVNNQLSGQLDYDSVKQNTAFGYQSLLVNTNDGYANTATGYQTLFSNTTGYDNTATGSGALHFNTTGGSNTATGSTALFSNNSGVSNTAIGAAALYENTSGKFNTAVGVSALFANESGEANCALGLQALFSNYSGIRNTANGYHALASSNGNGNTAIGYNALASNTSGSYNTALGYNSNVSGTGLTNATAIGYNAKVNASNKVRIGNTSVTSIGGQVNWTIYSDARVKKDIKENVPGLVFIKSLRPVTYHYDISKENKLLNENDDAAYWPTKFDIEKVSFTGLIAQEVDAAAKKINYDFSGIDKSGNIMGLRYAEFVTPLVKAVQELSIMNEEKDLRIIQLQQQLDVLSERLSALEKNAGFSNYISFSAPEGNNQIARFEQNTPNPFSLETYIKYYVPASVKKAQLLIADRNGKTIKLQDLAAGNGKLTIRAGELTSGTYTYTLYADGKLIDSKKMILTK